LSAVEVEIRGLNHVIIGAERVEIIGDKDAVIERIGYGNNRGVDGIGQQIRINNSLFDAEPLITSAEETSKPSRITLMPLVGKVAPSEVTVKLRVLAYSNGCVPSGYNPLKIGSSTVASTSA
jgi:hypothetical protein